jgi:hypothetical protein
MKVPHLYPPLLRTLLQLTEQSELTADETFGPLIILSYERPFPSAAPTKSHITI